MKILKNFKTHQDDPRLIIRPADFGAKKWCYDLQSAYLAHWDEEARIFELIDIDGVMRLDFEKKVLWRLNAPICCGKIDVVNEVISLVQRDNNEQITLLLYDLYGTKKASIIMEDVMYQSTFTIEILPEPMTIALDFGGGQDGIQSYFLQYKENNIKIIKKLPEDLSLLFTFDNHQKAVLLDFYENVFFVVSYPDLQEISRFDIGEEMQFDNLSKITDKIWLFSNSHNRHYIFDSQRMQIIDEIVVAGYEPQPNEDGELESNISDMAYLNGDIIFSHYEIIGKYPNIEEKTWWGVAELNGDPNWE